MADAGENPGVRDLVISHEQHKRAQDHADVADDVHDECFPSRENRRAARVPEADQEVRAQADQPPADDQEHEVPGQDQQQHREDEDVHVGEEAGVAGVVFVSHVADGVSDDQPADAGDDKAHEDREVVDQQVEGHNERAALDPRPIGEVARRLVYEERKRQHERGPDDAWADDRGHDPRQSPASAGEQDRAGGRQQEDQQRLLAGGHPFSSLRSSTSSTSRTRKMSTRIARPTTASAAATVMAINAKSWPSMFCSCLENATRVRLTAFNINSMQMRMTSGLRRTSTPTVPSVKRIAASSRNQEVSSCDPPMSSVLTGRPFPFDSNRWRRWRR